MPNIAEAKLPVGLAKPNQVSKSSYRKSLPLTPNEKVHEIDRIAGRIRKQ
jgi:hypothetical protein